MIWFVSFLLLLVGVVCSFTSMGDPSLLPWGIVAVVAGLGGFGFNYYQGQQRKKKEAARRARIMAREPEWGKDICEAVIGRRVLIDMTEEMAVEAWGRPNTKDENEVTAKKMKERWVYGTPRQGAKYLWFTDGKISKIKV